MNGTPIFTTRTVLLMIASGIVGFGVNYFSTRLANEKLLATITAQYDAILLAQQTARGSESERLNNRKLELEAQIKLLSKK